MPDYDPPVLGEPTDHLCSIAVFDGDDVLQEVRTDCPRPRFLAVLEALAVRQPASQFAGACAGSSFRGGVDRLSASRARWHAGPMAASRKRRRVRCRTR